MLFLLSLSNTSPISSNELTFFKFSSIVSYHICRGLPLSLFLIGLFSLNCLVSESFRLSLETYNLPTYLWLRNHVSSTYFTVAAGFSLGFLSNLSKLLLYTDPYIFLNIFFQNSRVFLHLLSFWTTFHMRKLLRVTCTYSIGAPLNVWTVFWRRTFFLLWSNICLLHWFSSKFHYLSCLFRLCFLPIILSPLSAQK